MLSDDLNEPLTFTEVIHHVGNMRQQSPNQGESMVIGRFCLMGLRVTRGCVRWAIRERDPLNTAL